MIFALAGIGCRIDSNRTGLRVQVSLGGLTVDQLEFTVSNSTDTPVNHIPRPRPAAGPLVDPQIIEVYLRDDLGNTKVTCEVVGLSSGKIVGSDSQNSLVVAHQLAPVSITLGSHGADGGADVHPDGNPVDRPEAGDAADAADAGGDRNDDAPKGLGDLCLTAAECGSGVCVDGVCCESTCGVCRACNVPGKAGTCAPVAVTTKSDLCTKQGTCGYDGTCDGQGGCFRPAAGQPCGAAMCQGGATLLPPSACDGQGACVPAVPVACAPFNCDPTGTAHCRTTCTVQGDCVSTAACTNNSCGAKPRKANGAGCVMGAECLSNVCADGVCCNMACGGQCQACNLTGQAGNCLNVPSGKSDPHGMCKDTGAASCGTNGQCNGSGGCLRYPVGTMCDSAQCLAHAIIGVKKCDANGTCMATGLTDCAPYRCNPANTMCFTTCMTNVECAVGTGAACRGGRCR